MIRRRLRDESGGSLVLALVVVTVMGVMSIAILSTVSAGATSTSVAGGRTALLYAAEAGMDHGVAALKADSSSCTSTSTTKAWPAATVNGSSVAISCSWLSGGASTGGALIAPYGLVTTVGGVAYGSGTSTGVALDLHGDVYSKAGLTVSTPEQQSIRIAGNLVTGTTCPTANVTVSGSCTPSQATTPSLPASLSVFANTTKADASLSGGGCTVLFPGRYGGAGGRALPTFAAGGSYYFASGSYYFRDITVALQGTVFGGAQGSATKQLSGVSPCATDALAQQYGSGYVPSGSGVSFVLSGSSTLSISGSTTRVELFPRVVGGADASATSGVSIHARRDTASAGTSYEPSTVADPSSIVSIASNAAAAVIHGLVNVPHARTEVSLLNNSAASGASVFRGGLVTSRLQVNVAGESGVSTPGTGVSGGGNRTVTLTSKATPSSGSPTTITARVVTDTGSISTWRVSDS